jgi:hypothetical protein
VLAHLRGAFDDDLGIDSLKRAEIVTALLNRFGEAPSDLKPLGPIPLTDDLQWPISANRPRRLRA